MLIKVIATNLEKEKFSFFLWRELIKRSSSEVSFEISITINIYQYWQSSFKIFTLKIVK